LYPEALAGYKLSIALWRAHGFQLELGLTRIGAARCLLGLDRWDEAADSLAGAREVLLPLRAAPFLDEIDALLGDDLERRLRSTGA
jgi:hypothetical protein